MKKNVMMRLASFLLIAVLISTSAISGTYAKYVTDGTGTDSARVAKWGVKVTANGAIFEKKYAKDDSTYTLGDNSVISSDEWKLVAPGTTHNMTEVLLTGKPEVATRVTYDATIEMNGWSVGAEEYCPVYFTIEGKTYGTDDSGLGFDVTYATVAELIEGVRITIGNMKKDYEPNTQLDSDVVKKDYPTVTWTWPFSTSPENDKKDTALGDAAAAGTPAGITFTIKTTVTQID